MPRTLSKGDRDALHQALRIAGRQTLPVTARSLTAPEVSAIDRSMTRVGLGVFFVVVAAILVMIVLDSNPNRLETLAFVVPFVVLIGLPFWLFLRWHARKRRDYRDPQIVVEVQESGLTLRSPGRVAELAFAGADFAFIAPVSKGRSVFLGIVLESPLDPLRLDDRSFKAGSAAAAAIVKQCDEGGMFAGATKPGFWE